ncbi:MAG: hypothetical protein U9N35_02540 [Euryarchaeota archaeon]|nr:hypothetical protein [Euryarchaeota archaeon]
MGTEIKSKNKYNQFKHHAWAGLGFLTLFLAAARVFSVPGDIEMVVTGVLIAYVSISLVFTYRYRKEFYMKENIPPRETLEKEKLKSEKKKAKTEAKIEKKRLKAELKAKKKERADR